MTNAGKWDRWYSLVRREDGPLPYGDSVTYELGGRYLGACDLVEDWGCGLGWFRKFLAPHQRYVGLDGSHSPFADEIVDLATYRSSVPGIFMRHVLEHDFRWKEILANATASFTERMVLVLFVPLSERGETYDFEWEEDPGVPNLSFDLNELLFAAQAGLALSDLPERCEYSIAVVPSPATRFGTETVIYFAREEFAP